MSFDVGTLIAERDQRTPVIAFNVRSKELSTPLERVKLVAITGNEVIPLIFKNSTHADETSLRYILSIQQKISAAATTLISKEYWGNLPTYDNYNNLDELYDADETEELFFQAAQKRGW
ncbi:MAG: hypothetical protein H7256_12760 [Bdellovibrio sp.]|nr:hypothetical protein [Bdellovibrio sp.]